MHEGVPEGEYLITLPKEMLCGFGFTVTKRAVIVTLGSNSSMEYLILKVSSVDSPFSMKYLASGKT